MPGRRDFIAGAARLLLATAAGRDARGQASPPRIGFLNAFELATAENFYELLRPELHKLGWSDGRNIQLLPPKASGGRNELLPAMAAELVDQAPALILVQSLPATRAAMQATRSIPIVMVSVGSPVEYGIVADYRKPGGNVTGSRYPNEEATGKLLQFLKEAAPRLRSVALFANPNNEAAPAMARRNRADATALGLQLQVVEVQGAGDFEAAFAAIARAGTESILLPPEPLILTHRELIAAFAHKQGLPLVLVGVGRALPASGLMAFGPPRAEYAEITARFINRVLKGAKPAELPIEQPTRFELTVNLKTAQALGLSLPQSLLLRATEVIR